MIQNFDNFMNEAYNGGQGEFKINLKIKTKYTPGDWILVPTDGKLAPAKITHIRLELANLDKISVFYMTTRGIFSEADVSDLPADWVKIHR